jgi:uncharacterized lipoprotein YddW (UPF0748 family)
MRVPHVRLPLVTAAALAACQVGPRLHADLGRCIWIDRWDYRSAADIESAMETCKRAGFTAVMFQVRGNGTVYYPSSIEVWSEHFGFRDPGFDPLATAVAAAHARGLQLHAWVNVAPGWVGVDEPTDERQLWQGRRDWFLHDRETRPPQRQKGKYLALNLCLPEVRAYTVDLCREIVTRYDVDGLHLDYIRFPEPEQGAVGELGTDPVTIMLYSGATGRRDVEAPSLHRWQQQCVTRVVADVSAALRASHRHVWLSAAVWADRDEALAKVRQDWPEWCRKRLVDAVVPMNYTDDDARFAALVRDGVAAADGVPVIVGVGVYKHRSGEQSRAQLDLVLAGGGVGVGVFNYRSLFGSSPEVPPERQRELREGVGEWIEAAARGR